MLMSPVQRFQLQFSCILDDLIRVESTSGFLRSPKKSYFLFCFLRP